MDANKLQVLRDLPYTVQPVCGLCVHGTFVTPNNDWGTCAVLTYEHKKHTGPARQLSIVKYGSCSKFEPDPVKTAGLQHFGEAAAGLEDMTHHHLTKKGHEELALYRAEAERQHLDLEDLDDVAKLYPFIPEDVKALLQEESGKIPCTPESLGATYIRTLLKTDKVDRKRFRH